LRRWGAPAKTPAMKRATLLATSFGTATALLFTSCSDIPAGQEGPFTNGAAVGGDMARSLTVTSAESMATGSNAGSLVAATVVILAKHQATEKQRQVALKRAKVALVHLKAKQARAEAKPKPKTEVAKKEAPRKEAAPTKLPRYIAVDTSRDERTAPAAEKAVVIFDTETQEIVGNNVYDVKSTPPVGGTARFETFTAEYVGNGS
jgi:hypothetical protein